MRLTLSACLATALAMALMTAATPSLAQDRTTAPPIQATAERPILFVDQVRSAPFPKALAPQFEPLKTLEQVEALLKSKGVQYRRGYATLDTRTANPKVAAAIAALPAGEVFIIPEAEFVTFSRVLAALTPAEAAEAAKAMRGKET